MIRNDRLIIDKRGSVGYAWAVGRGPWAVSREPWYLITVAPMAAFRWLTLTP